MNISNFVFCSGHLFPVAEYSTYITIASYIPTIKAICKILQGLWCEMLEQQNAGCLKFRWLWDILYFEYFELKTFELRPQ